jgi:hypothetical protein
MVFWGGAKSYDGEKAWSSIEHSILSVRDGHWGGSKSYNGEKAYIIQYSLYGMVFGRGAKSYDGEKAWSSIDHLILSVPDGLHTTTRKPGPL